MAEPSNEELPSSALGTKEYWDDMYKLEHKNFEEIGDKGEVWFGEAAMNRMIRWLEKNVPTSASIIDLGCGNGLMSIELYQLGFTNVCGVDYSPYAVELADKLAKDSGIDKDMFQTCDVLKIDNERQAKYDVCLDKGTYDAVSLNPDSASEMRLSYKTSVHHMLKEGGIFFITSCNWTDEELKRSFSDCFSVKSILPTPKLKFGGQSGSNVTTIVFQKK